MPAQARQFNSGQPVLTLDHGRSNRYAQADGPIGNSRRGAIRQFDESYELIESRVPCLNDGQRARLILLMRKANRFLRDMGGGVMNTVRGRAAERRLVRDLLLRAQGGSGGALLVEGEPGIGKSALLRDSVARAAGLGFSLAVGAADPLGQPIPLAEMRQAPRPPVPQLTPPGGPPRGAHPRRQ